MALIVKMGGTNSCEKVNNSTDVPNNNLQPRGNSLISDRISIEEMLREHNEWKMKLAHKSALEKTYSNAIYNEYARNMKPDDAHNLNKAERKVSNVEEANNEKCFEQWPVEKSASAGNSLPNSQLHERTQAAASTNKSHVPLAYFSRATKDKIIVGATDFTKSAEDAIR